MRESETVQMSNAMQCSNDNDNGFTEHGSILSAVLWRGTLGGTQYRNTVRKKCKY